MKKKLWFKRKRYGWGWVPVTWQGWVAVFSEILFVILLSQVLLSEHSNDSIQPELDLYFLGVFVSVVVLIGLSYYKGPPPKWRWGKQSSDDPELDF